jgi:hypothetical protein
MSSVDMARQRNMAREIVRITGRNKESIAAIYLFNSCTFLTTWKM